MTFLDSAGDGVLKIDALGRVRVPRPLRERLLREFANGGISARRFAQLVGVNPATFYSCVQKERARGCAFINVEALISFMEVRELNLSSTVEALAIPQDKRQNWAAFFGGECAKEMAAILEFCGR